LVNIVNALGIKPIKNSEARFLAADELGVCMFEGCSNEWFLIYDDKEPPDQRRFTIAHELGHIILGMEFDERDADMFAICLLSPACVLRALGVYTAKEVSDICQIPMAEAHIAAEYVDLLRKREGLPIDPLEQAVYERFLGFIEGWRRT
jgi:Zn-dependent peptidase ImmA (M78 family)